MEIKIEDDGITHINVYSKGKTALGRFLSNFALSPFNHPIDGSFKSIEGYWYWLSCKNDALRNVYGFQAKALGRKLGGKDWMDTDEFKDKIKEAISLKLLGNEKMFNALKENKLPLMHYYVYGDKIVEPKDGKWILEYLLTIL